MSSKSKITIGGQALIEGVMMRSLDKYAIAVRKPNGKISLKKVPIKNNDKWYYNFPFLRGIFRFVETLVIGVQAINYSALESLGEDSDSISNKELFFTVLFSVGMTILLFYFLPLLLTNLFTNTSGVLFNLIDGILRLVIFISYLLIISFIPDIKRIFMYHGAEHKTVYAYENKEKLTVKNIQKYTTLHPRCGTNFILIVFVSSLIVFTLIDSTNFFVRLGYRVVFLPIIAGISYEILRFAGKHFDNPLVKIIIFPGLMLQMITTKQPTDDMVEVAVKSLKGVL